jgi:large subunit ribosomal protein L25
MNSLKAEKRDIVGRKVSTLRAKGLIPANIFGNKVKSLSITVDFKDFLKTFKEAGETGLIEISVGSEKRPVLIHNVQFHPVTDTPLHVDFLQVDLKEKVTAEVSVELVGESPAVKQNLGTIVQYLNEIEVKALPADLPEKFIIDVSELKEVEQSVQIKDLKYDKKKVEIEGDVEEIVVKVEPPKKVEEEPVSAPVVPAEGEIPESGEEPGETEKAETEPPSK